MSAIMSDTGILRYRVPSSLAMPATIELDGDLLRWEIRDVYSLARPGEQAEQYARRPTSGCLKEFTRLASAGPGEVLAFTQSRGVLSIEPLVMASGKGKMSNTGLAYAEPVFVYTQMAARFASILSVAASLKEGREVKYQDMIGCYEPSIRRTLEGTEPRAASRAAYDLLWFTIKDCWKSASIEMTLVGLEAAEDGLNFNSSEIMLLFGVWENGLTWDFGMAARARGSETIAAPQHHRLEALLEALEEGAKAATIDTLKKEGYSEAPSGELVIPYRDYLHGGGSYPRPHMRPSPLFNLLAFQLLKEVSSVAGKEVCTQCEKLYTYDPDKAKRPRDPIEAADTSTWGNSKPRKDRPTAFCSEKCRKEYDAADNRIRRKQPKPKPAGQ